MKTAVLSFFYPKAIPFIYEFKDSLNKQTDKDFTLFVVNDGVANVKKSLSDVLFNVKIKDAEGTPAKLRKTGISWVLESGIDIIIFADSDDLFLSNRVEVLKQLLQRNQLVFHELLIFEKDISSCRAMFQNRFSEGVCIDENSIKNGNCLGLSNTALKSVIINDSYKKIPEENIVFDWAFYARILASGNVACYTRKTATYYRQHGNNTASPVNYTDKQIAFGVKLKYYHYLSLSESNKWYKEKMLEYKRLFNKIEQDKEYKKLYCESVRTKANSVSLWWEQIKTPEDLELLI